MSAPARDLTNKAGLIRRVLHRGNQHVCGMCLSSHDVYQDALQCLVDCFAEFLSYDPVVLRRFGLKLRYRCRFCARDYGTHAQAHSCGEACKAEQELLFESELNNLGHLPPAVKRRRRAKGYLVAVGQSNRSWKKHSEDDGNSHAETSPEPATDAEPINADVPTPPTPAPAAEMEPVVLGDDEPGKGPKEKKVKPSEIYTRQGAKYECTVCKERYFTAEEVTKCWESH